MKFKEVKELPAVTRNKPSKYDKLIEEFNKSKIKLADITEHLPKSRLSSIASELRHKIEKKKFKITVIVRNKKVYLKKS